MSKPSADVSWIKYLQELHAWITELYSLANQGKIAEDKYFTDLKHYNEEVARVTKYLQEEKLIPPLPPQNYTVQTKKRTINPDMIKSFFETNTTELIGKPAEIPPVAQKKASDIQKGEEVIAESLEKTEELETQQKDDLETEISIEAGQTSSEVQKPTPPTEEAKSQVAEMTSVSESISVDASKKIPKNINILEDQANLKNIYKSMLKIRDSRQQHEATAEGKLMGERVFKIPKFKIKPVVEQIKINDELKNFKLEPEGETTNIEQKLKRKQKTRPASSHKDFFSLDSGEQKKVAKTNIIIIGNSGVGCTSIRRVFFGQNFVARHLSTMGAAIDEKAMEISGKKIVLNLIDLAGADFYAPIRMNFYRNVSIALIVFDVSERLSFQQIDKWINELYFNSGKRAVPFVLVGNKIDLKRKIKKKAGIKLADKLSQQTQIYGFKVSYYEVSAKENWNIEELFTEIAKKELLKMQL